MTIDHMTAWTAFTEAWNTGNVDLVDDIFDPDMVYHMPPFPDLNLDGLKYTVIELRKGFPDFKAATYEPIMDGGSSTYRWHVEGTLTNENALVPAPPTGKHTTAFGTHFLHWRDGKVVEAWHNGDWLGWLQGAGVIPALG